MLSKMLMHAESNIYSKRKYCSIYLVYTQYIPVILHQPHTVLPASSPSLFSSLRPGRLAEPLSFGHRQAANARLRAPE